MKKEGKSDKNSDKKYICIRSNDLSRKDVIVMSIAEIYYYFYYYTHAYTGNEREVDITAAWGFSYIGYG